MQAPQKTHQQAPPVLSSEVSPVEQMLLVNDRVRANAGKQIQTIDKRLCRAAQEQAEYLARTGQFDHFVNGNPQSRAAKHGFTGSVRENLAGDFQNVQNCFGGWCDSPTHYATIISDCDLCGFGMARGPMGNVWCAVYGQTTN